MNHWSTAILSIEFVTTAVNSRTMHLSIDTQDSIETIGTLPEGKWVWKKYITLPARVCLWFDNRNGVTTLVDEQGNITKNMSVKINTVSLDGLPCWEYWTEHSIITECSDTQNLLIGSTVCANGCVELLFDATSAFEWAVKTKLS